MLKRRNIRETAIQFLYLADLEDGPEAIDMQEAFWEMTQESSLIKLGRARGKAILHLAQGRDIRIAKLVKHAATHQPELSAAKDTAELGSVLGDILTQEKTLCDAIESLKSTLKIKGGSPMLEDQIQSVLDIDHSLIRLRTGWHQALENSPAWQNKLEPITAAITQLQRVSERLGAIDDPESSIGDLAHLRASKAELTAMREETQSLVKNILTHKEQIDESLAGVIENYAPERVAPVDRAILRLASYEILYRDDIPRAVTINEALEIAKKFGSSESARFINGVLDAL